MHKTKKMERLNEAIELLQQVQNVNQFIQGFCARISAHEMNEGESRGLWAVLEWQNEKIRCAEHSINSSLIQNDAMIKAA